MTAKKKAPQKNKSLIMAAIVAVVILGVGLSLQCFGRSSVHPKVLVWAATTDVEVPKSLSKYLQTRTEDCTGYYGDNTAPGVPLFAIESVVGGKYAKVAIGCSTSLSSGFPVILTSSGWGLLSGAEYYVSAEDDPAKNEPAFLPRCSVVDKYGLPRTFEPSCYEDNAEENPTIRMKDLREVN